MIDRSGAPAHPAAAAVLWHELRRLAAEQPDRREIEAATAQAAAPADLADPELLLEQQSGRLYQFAQRELFDVSDAVIEEDLARAAGVSPGDVQAAAASWLATAMVVVPAGTDVELAGLARTGCPLSTFVPDGLVLEPSPGPFWRRRRKAALGERLVIGEEACCLVGVDGAVHTFPMADIVVVEDGPRALMGNIAHGCLVDITAFGGRGLFSVPAARPPTPQRRPVRAVKSWAGGLVDPGDQLLEPGDLLGQRGVPGLGQGDPGVGAAVLVALVHLDQSGRLQHGQVLGHLCRRSGPARCAGARTAPGPPGGRWSGCPAVLAGGPGRPGRWPDAPGRRVRARQMHASRAHRGPRRSR